MGRQTKCDDMTIGLIVGGIRLGLSQKEAAMLADISEVSLSTWLRRGREEIARVDESSLNRVRQSEEPFVKLVNAVEKAIPERKALLLQNIRNASENDWRAGGWLLERLHADEFSLKHRLQVEVSWREQAKEVGLSAGELMNELVGEIAREAAGREGTGTD